MIYAHFFGVNYYKDSRYSPLSGFLDACKNHQLITNELRMGLVFHSHFISNSSRSDSNIHL